MSRLRTLPALLRLARPYQWTKNGFVLAGLLFGHAWSQPDTLRAVLWMLAAFCLASSAVYVLNDLADLEADRRHPEKRLRPLASGALARNVAVLWSLLLALAACALAALASQTGLALVLAYLFLNIGYSAGAKHVPVLDVVIIATGFMLRLLAGTWGVGIAPSGWLLLCGGLMTLFLGFAKRRAEFGLGEAHTLRPALSGYSARGLDRLMLLAALGCALAYVCYTLDPHTVQLHRNAHLEWTVPPVLFGLLRYGWLVQRRGAGGDPSRELLRDWPLAGAVVTWLVLVLLLLY